MCSGVDVFKCLSDWVLKCLSMIILGAISYVNLVINKNLR